MSYEIEERVLHFKQPAGTSRGVYTTRTSWFVRLREDGREGVGECAPLPDLSCDARADYAEVLDCFCVDLCRTGQLDDEALRDYPSMRFGLETALLALQHGNLLFDTAFSRVGWDFVDGTISIDDALAQIDQEIADAIAAQ